MTIRSEHPFLPPESERDGLRRFRGRLAGGVSLWTTGESSSRSPADAAGLTVTSALVVAGDPGHVLGLLDPDSQLAEELVETRTAAVQLLQWQHRQVADAFAGVAPAPGGLFRLGEWTQSAWGPVLAGVSAWAGVRMTDRDPTSIGYSVLVDTVVEHVELLTESDPLLHRRGSYFRLSA
jgi:flavin reductase (DIM6/NTAB) family NADH-FMN oxidoreductase RutF